MTYRYLSTMTAEKEAQLKAEAKRRGTSYTLVLEASILEHHLRNPPVFLTDQNTCEKVDDGVEI